MLSFMDNSPNNEHLSLELNTKKLSILKNVSLCLQTIQKLRLDYVSFTAKKHIWDKVFKNGPSKICGRQPLKNLKYGLLKQTISLQIF